MFYFPITYLSESTLFRSTIFSQSISIEYKVESTLTEHEGIYKCIASNKYGTSERSVKIIVFSSPFIEYKLSENQYHVKIPCNLTPKLKLERPSLKWFFGESEIIPDNKVYKVNMHRDFHVIAFNKISKIFHRLKI